ncbi:ABC transporter ATP-binding protein [Mycoplasmopsis ciconiae]|uniref:ABC transporter ATP-binding protein n=1 Tax=Mycoplasmopsis ciconiae TaxID=561067 RepID=A0ABU7MLG1_9BACT|nr:ABC transporter ATP-binding protein [Mycoplasmopsis ciconiae]
MYKLIKFLPNTIKIKVFLAFFTSIWPAFFSLLIPSFIKQFITLSTGTKQEFIQILVWNVKPSIAQIDFLVICVISCALLMLIFDFLSFRLTAYAIQQSTYYMRKILFDKILNLSKQDIDKLEYATIITRFGNDINKAADGGIFVLCKPFSNAFFSIIWGLVFSLLISPLYSISMLIMVPLLFLGSFFAIKKLFPFYRKENVAIDKINNSSKEDINGINLIKTYNLEQKQKEKFIQKNTDLFSIGLKADRINTVAWRFIDFAIDLGNLSVYIIFGLIAYQFSSENISLQVGNVYQFISYLAIIAGGIFTFSFNINFLFRASASAKRLFEIFELKPSITLIKNNNYVENTTIKFENVYYQYPSSNKATLKNISFEIKPNTLVGIVGRTGSGKSTIVNLLLREIQPQSGNIYIGNKNIETIDTQNYYQNVSAVFQNSMIISGTIESNVKFANPYMQTQELEEISRLACADFIDEYQLKYQQLIGQKGINLSGGQKQRLAIVQALVKNPKILIMDDTTSALDNKTDKQLRKNVINSYSQTTKIIIAQRISSIKDADQIIVLNDGQIDAIGTHSQLLKESKTYFDIYKSQTE